MTWLHSKQISTEEGMLKRDLLHLVSQVKHKYDGYYLDDQTKKKGHCILRLPPYHCNLNPIEMVWAQLKNYIRQNNTTFKKDDMIPLIDRAYQSISVENWCNYVEHIKKGKQESRYIYL